MRRMKWSWLGASSLLFYCLAGAGAASAQADPSPPAQDVSSPTGSNTSLGTAGRTIYQASYFATFSPSNALEIVRRVPGFTLDVGSQDVRGFGQAAGNVVINGSRPSSKSDTLETILARIPASRVARVETGPGDLFGSEFSGRPQVVNLVTTAVGGLAGTVNAQVQRTYDGRYAPAGGVSLLLRRGHSSFNASAGYNNSATTEEGYDSIRELPGNRLREIREKVNRYADRSAYLSGSWEHGGGENRTAHLNGRFQRAWFDLDQDNDVFPALGVIRDDRLNQNYDNRNIEIGGDITRPLLGGGIKLIGLATRRHRVNVDTSLNRVQGQVIGGFVQDLENQRNESVVRLVWNRSKLRGWSVEIGSEGVLNSLDSNVNLFSIDAGGTPTRIDLPVDQAVVKEYRGEAFVTAGRPLSSTLRMDLGVTFEASRLTVSGDAQAERVLKFLKPKATFDWRPKGGWRAQLSMARTVAQLQFEDFISSAELTNDRVNGGNADLLPQRAWETRLTVERKILGDGLVKIEAGYDQISLVQDRVPTPEGFDAPGNLGNGRIYILRSTLDTPLARLGIKGGRLTFHTSYVDSSVEDPYTLQQRHFSGYSIFSADASFRQDLGKFAYGASFYVNTPTLFFRQDEVDKPHSQNPYVTAFVEYRPTPKTTLTFSLDNLTNVAAFRSRTFYFPDRTNMNPGLFEFRHRNKHVIPQLSVKHSFG